jgi:5-methylcytosine-specific restriction endonuclease McrA
MSSATAASGSSGGYRRTRPDERPTLLDGALAAAPQGRARPRRRHLPDPRLALHGYATTVHHRVPSSLRPDLFWEPDNLAAACSRCNYGGGARATRLARSRQEDDGRLWSYDLYPWRQRKTAKPGTSRAYR